MEFPDVHVILVFVSFWICSFSSDVLHLSPGIGLQNFTLHSRKHQNLSWRKAWCRQEWLSFHYWCSHQYNYPAVTDVLKHLRGRTPHFHMAFIWCWSAFSAHTSVITTGMCIARKSLTISRDKSMYKIPEGITLSLCWRKFHLIGRLHLQLPCCVAKLFHSLVL